MKLVKWLDKNLELLILAIMLAVMCCLSFANVIMRYGFHHALTWSDEICCYLLALSAFYCLPCAVRHGVSIKVDTFTTMMPESLQKTLGLVCDGVMILLLAYLFKGTQGKKTVYRVLTASTDAIGNVHLGKKLKKMINDDSFAYTVIHPVSPLFSADMDAIFDLKNHQPQEYEFEVLAKYLGMLRQIYRIYCHTNHNDTITHNADLEILREMMAFVGENYQEDITVDALAREGNVSRSKCTRLFRDYLQQSPIEYVQNYRLERSVVLLRTTNASLSEVARKCGFNQQSYFNRLFMRKFHMTPKQMRIKE